MYPSSRAHVALACSPWTLRCRRRHRRRRRRRRSSSLVVVAIRLKTTKRRHNEAELLRITLGSSSGVGEMHPRRDHGVGVEAERVDTLLHEPLREVGEVRGSLPADAHVLAAGLRRLDDVRQGLLHGGGALVEVLGDEAGVAVEAERELREVVGADGEPVEVVEELVGEEDVRGQLGHHLHLEAVVAPLEPVAFEHVVDLLGHLQRAHEGDHELDVGEPHLLAHLLHGQQLELEALAERLVRVAPRAAEPDHGVLLVRLEQRPAEQRLVLVRLEVRQAHDDAPGVHARGERPDALGDLVDVEGHGVGVALGFFEDGVAQVLRQLVEA
mmetsp:Transcript_19074/g.36714  ORF Transcript_19074/g.36714 Transcript_19074/m.36714 type:complete len:327 (-) Transcript_19074:1929-2909(-)